LQEALAIVDEHIDDDVLGAQLSECKDRLTKHAQSSQPADGLRRRLDT